MDWTVYNFECADAAARDRFLDYFEAHHPVEFPDDDEATHQEIRDADGETQGAEYAWIRDSPYLYVTSLEPVAGLLETTAAHWERAVRADFDSTTESCRGATLYEAAADGPREVDSYDGIAEFGGAGVLWRCAVEHRFRFRAYSAGPPTTIVAAPITSAFEYIPADREEEFVSSLEAETGVERTPEAMAFVREDPSRRRGEGG